MSRDTEEDLIGLYAIAREELKAIELARHQLNQSTGKLDQLSRLIREESKKGVEASLSDLKLRNEEILKDGVKSALNGLTEAVTHASKSLKDTNFAWLLFFCCLGVLLGASVSVIIFSMEFEKIINSQYEIKKELKDIKTKIQSDKLKYPHGSNLKNKG